MIAVADGVGGWIRQGIDPSKYSRKLCTNADKYFHEDYAKYISNPK